MLEMASAKLTCLSGCRSMTLYHGKSVTSAIVKLFRRSVSGLSQEDGDYSKPVMKTTLPGPKSQDALRELATLQCTGTMHFVADYEKSQGNFIVDIDGNIILDIYQQIASMPLGYNHPAIKEAVQSPKNISMFINRPALAVTPPGNYLEDLRRLFLEVAPPGLRCVQTMMCGACSVENAYKVAFIRYKALKRGSLDPTEYELQSCLKQQPPGSPDLCILSFENAFHGRTFGALSTTRSKAIHKVDLPAFRWPIIPFPKLKYPLEEHVEDNRDEESKCLEKAFEGFKNSNQRGRYVAGLIVEPVQGEGGNNEASPYFFRSLQAMCKEFDAAFIVDEIQTGVGVTGKFWAHEHWNLPEPPDVVTFAKKMLTGGYYFKEQFMPVQPLRIFNTWMGDPSKLVLLEPVLATIKRDNLLERTRNAGAALMDGLVDLQKRYPDLLSNARGMGTFLGIDLKDAETLQRLSVLLRNAGLENGGCGERTLRFRPPLIFTDKHAGLVMDIIDSTLAKIR